MNKTAYPNSILSQEDTILPYYCRKSTWKLPDIYAYLYCKILINKLQPNNGSFKSHIHTSSQKVYYPIFQ